MPLPLLLTTTDEDCTLSDEVTSKRSVRRPPSKFWFWCCCLLLAIVLVPVPIFIALKFVTFNPRAWQVTADGQPITPANVVEHMDTACASPFFVASFAAFNQASPWALVRF